MPMLERDKELIMTRSFSTLDPDNLPPLLTVQEVRHLLRVHRPKVYDLIKEGLLDGEKVGSCWRVKRYSIEKYLKPTRNNGQKID